jgi:hypothetical protein
MGPAANFSTLAWWGGVRDEIEKRALGSHAAHLSAHEPAQLAIFKVGQGPIGNAEWPTPALNYRSAATNTRSWPTDRGCSGRSEMLSGRSQP